MLNKNMIITITGPRSVGKSTISKILAKKLKMKYISADAIGEKALKKHGGLDNAIKTGIIKNFIKKRGYSLLKKEYKKDNFVFDLSAGSISSEDFPKASKELRNLAISKSLVIGLLPFEDKNSSINLLFKRERKRVHFNNLNKKELLSKTRKHYIKLIPLFNTFCDIIIYTENKDPRIISDNIIKLIKK